jgi:hypothetical protein
MRLPLLDEKMGIDPSEAEGANSRPPGNSVTAALPGNRFGQHPEGTVLKVNLCRRGAEIGGRRQYSGVHGEKDLDKRRGAGCGKEVADVRFDRTENTAVILRSGIPPEFPETGKLRGVANWGACGVAFD